MSNSTTTPRTIRTLSAITPLQQQQLASTAAVAANVSYTPSRTTSRASLARIQSPMDGTTAVTPTSPFDLSAQSVPSSTSTSTSSVASSSTAPRDRINVCIRLRPNIDGHQTSITSIESVYAEPDGKHVRLVRPNGLGDTQTQYYKYDRAYAGRVTQQQVVQDVIPEYISAACNGINGTIMAYGQTGSGKVSNVMLWTQTDLREIMIRTELTNEFDISR